MDQKKSDKKDSVILILIIIISCFVVFFIILIIIGLVIYYLIKTKQIKFTGSNPTSINEFDFQKMILSSQKMYINIIEEVYDKTDLPNNEKKSFLENLIKAFHNIKNKKQLQQLQQLQQLKQLQYLPQNLRKTQSFSKID